MLVELSYHLPSVFDLKFITAKVTCHLCLIIDLIVYRIAIIAVTVEIILFEISLKTR